jgi:hypothetical protein
MHDSFLYKEQMMKESLQAAHAAIKELSKRIAEKASIRDQFAMAALPALICDPDSVAYPIGHAKLAYEYADAMMEARK